MALTVREVMNPETFTVKPADPVDDTLATLLALRLSAAPVIDEAGRGIGMVSWRDLVKFPGTNQVESRMSRPLATVRDSDLIEAAGRVMATTGHHHVAVVDAEGAVVGFLSLLDVVRGLLGVPAPHPAGFPHYDDEAHVIWTDERALEDAEIEHAPEGAGVIVLVRGGRNRSETVVWAEPTNDIRARLIDLVSEPSPTPQLGRWLESGELRFRAAQVPDAEERKKLADVIMNRARRRQWLERLGH